MICSMCGGQWERPIQIIRGRRQERCSVCGFESGRNGSVGGIPHGPNSPLMGDPKWVPATLFEYLRVWYKEKK